MYIYLAHPIDFTGEHAESVRQVVAEAKQALLEAGATAIYTPANAWLVAPDDMHSKIQEVNMCALMRAEAVLFIYPEGVPSIGVPFEMGVAYGANIPSVLIRGRTTAQARQMRKTSAMLAFIDSPIYGYDDLSAAAVRVVTLAIYRKKISDQRKDQENTNERTGK